MSKDINLVSIKDSGEIKHKKKVRLARIIAMVSLISVSALTASLFILSNQISLARIKSDQSSVLQGISSLRIKAAKLTLLNNRLNDTSEIVKIRHNYTTQVNSVLEVLPERATLKVLEIDEEDGFNVTVEAISLLSINEFIDGITEITNKKTTFTRLRVENIIFNEKVGIYSVSLKADLI